MIQVYDVVCEIFFRSLERSNFLSVWLSSGDGDLSDRINLPIAIMRLCYFADRDLRDCVILVGQRFKPWAKQCNFYWSWVRFPGQIACFRPV